MKNTQINPNNIIETMKLLGRTHMGKGELDLRIDWYNQCGSYLTPIETFDLKIAKGEKLNSYEKTQYKQLKQSFADTKELIKNLEKLS